MLRLLLPPNLAATAPRDAIAVKVELNPAAPLPPELLPALALLQRWCGAAAPPAFLQLTRARLDELLAALAGQPVFFWAGQPPRPVPWQGANLVGVSEHLAESLPASATQPPLPEAKPPPPKPFARRAEAAPAPLLVDGSEHFLALTLPSREHPAYAAALDLVKSHGFLLETSNRKWWLRDRHKTLNFLAAHGTRLRDGFHAQFTPNFRANTAHLRPVEITAQTGETGGDFQVTLALQAGPAGDEPLRAALASSRGYVENAGAVYLLDPARLEKFAAAQRALSAETAAPGAILRHTHRLPAARLAEAEELIEAIAPDFQPPAVWRARTAALRRLSALAPAPVPAALDARLRPYQRLGVAWLWHLRRHGLGGILADEMGLGKTLQALALLAALADAPQTPGAPPVSLVVCPASLMENWRREAARFTPHLRVFVHHGASRLASPADFAAYDLVVTSYGTLNRDRALFAGTEFDCLVADEAQHLKNRRSQNAQTLRALRARSRFLLTGTPLENSLDDLRSLFEILLPGALSPVPAGLRGDERAWSDQRLRAQTAPYILRRTKQTVAPELPPKIEQTLYCELTPAQAALYRETRQRAERELLDLAGGGASEARLRFATLTQLLRLRQICCDPRLVATPPPPAPRSSIPASALSPLSDPFPDSAKLDAFRELLAEALDGGHRLLVFSQFTSLLALLRAELDEQAVAHCYLDGSMPPRQRQAEVDRFSQSADIPVFLLSLKAGGTGLNLTGADTVVHFDPWWNPAVEAQATDRAHRLGQTRAVTSYKLICAGTVEEKVQQLQESKRALLAGVFEASDAAAAQLSLADLRDLLAPPAA